VLVQKRFWRRPTEGPEYVQGRILKRKKDAQTPTTPTHLDAGGLANVGLTRHGAFWFSYGRLRLGGRVEAREKKGDQLRCRTGMEGDDS
jgi:hypothetical protein